MTNRRRFLLVSAAAICCATMAQASASIVTPHEAHDAVTAGKMILIDIRTPGEWQSTGVAQGAWLLDMTDDQFGPRLLAVLERNPAHKVAIICRTGNRSGYLMDVLAQNGISGVIDVSAGMAGGTNGTGWIPAGLPIVDAKDAFDAMPKDLRAA